VEDVRIWHHRGWYADGIKIPAGTQVCGVGGKAAITGSNNKLTVTGRRPDLNLLPRSRDFSSRGLA
jgi:hypothetical protein